MSSLSQTSRVRHADAGAREVVFKPENSDRREAFPARDHFQYFFREIVLHNAIVTLAEDIARRRDGADSRASREALPPHDTVESLRQRLNHAGKEAAFLLNQLEDRLAGMPDDATQNPYLDRADAVRLNRRQVNALLRILPNDSSNQ